MWNGLIDQRIIEPFCFQGNVKEFCDAFYELPVNEKNDELTGSNSPSHVLVNEIPEISRYHIGNINDLCNKIRRVYVKIQVRN